MKEDEVITPDAAIEDERIRLHIILDQLPEGVLITEVSTGAISYANAAAATLLGIPLENLIGTTLRYPQATHKGLQFESQHLYPWQFAAIQALYRETVTSQETLITRPDGRTIIALTSSAPLWVEHGVMKEAVVVFQDITAHKRLEQQKSEFLWMANHELRTPITIIQGFAEILLQREESERSMDASMLYALTQISEQSQQLTRLIEEMLDVSRIEQSHLTLHIASHDLLHCLKQAIEGQSITTHKHTIYLTVEGLQATETLVANFDEERIRRVFHNLISNAIKYSPTGGEIEVGLRVVAERPDEALIWVKDEGIGIAAHEVPYIFQRFYRASTLDHSLSGLGIGLYLVKEIILCHGGRVWVESVEGKGSTFFLLLPL